LVVDNSREPVTTAPTTELAKPPDPVADAPVPLEDVKEEDPVGDAARHAIKERLAETQRAAKFAQQRQAQQPPQERFAEPEPETPQMEDPREQFEAAIQHLPDRVKGWYRAEPRSLTDPLHASRMQYTYHAAAHEIGEADTDAHLDRMEHML